MQVGIINPGDMGSAMGALIDAEVVWASNGRSDDSHGRAKRHGFRDVGSMRQLVAEADLIVSVCPPDAALSVAEDVARKRFAGIYVDANAISPTTCGRIARLFPRFVDAGIFGSPPREAGVSRMYLCGDDAAVVASLWEGTHLEPIIIEGPPGSASALKMAYAGWTKGSAALLFAMRAYAESMGVVDQLLDEWDRSIPGLTDRIQRRATGTGPKAWRFAGEMEEIAAALESTDLPPGFHEAAAEIYIRIADLRDIDHPTLAEVMAHLVGSEVH